jgi:hypothetical protein
LISYGRAFIPVAGSAALAHSVEVVNARDRFRAALAEAVSKAYYVEGDLYLSIERINMIAAEEQVPDADVRAVLDLLGDQGLLRRQEGGWAYGDGIALMLCHEEADRRLA